MAAANANNPMVWMHPKIIIPGLGFTDCIYLKTFKPPNSNAMRKRFSIGMLGTDGQLMHS